MNAAPTAAMWSKFCAAMDLGALEHDPDYATPHARRDNRARLNEIITEKTKLKTTAEWITLLNDAGVPCGPINRMDEVFADEQVKHLNVAQVMHSPVRGDVEIVGQPAHLTRTPSRIAEPTPEMGQHTQSILEEIGVSKDEIEQLKTTGVV
jgi:crotonobetainyl-CoA:carnitine CoA-transferase CaiB-like acyl-CoA transferase